MWFVTHEFENQTIELIKNKIIDRFYKIYSLIIVLNYKSKIFKSKNNASAAPPLTLVALLLGQLLCVNSKLLISSVLVYLKYFLRSKLFSYFNNYK